MVTELHTKRDLGIACHLGLLENKDREKARIQLAGELQCDHLLKWCVLQVSYHWSLEGNDIATCQCLDVSKPHPNVTAIHFHLLPMQQIAAQLLHQVSFTCKSTSTLTESIAFKICLHFIINLDSTYFILCQPHFQAWFLGHSYYQHHRHHHISSHPFAITLIFNSY